MTLANHPPHDRWNDWTELDARAWPARVERRYTLVPTTCFNCEAACGLVAYVDRDTGSIARFEGNPEHPASRGRNCAKGPATLNQVDDPERVLYPLKRAGERGAGRWVHHMGPGARRGRRPHPPSVRGGPTQRGDVPRRSPR
jgi:anaerobic selenocysteine-containing dehydrogenase